MIEKRINGGNFQPVMTDKLVLDSTPTVNSLNGVTSDAVARAVAGASGEVPQVTENDSGKVLTAIYDEGGPAVEWGDAPSGLPDTTGASQGDVLTVGDNGPEWATPSAGGGFSPTLVATADRNTGVFTDMPEAGLQGWYVLECKWYRNSGSGMAGIKVYWEDNSEGLSEVPLCCATSGTLGNSSTDEPILVYSLFYVQNNVSGVPIKIKITGDSGMSTPPPEINTAKIYAL